MVIWVGLDENENDDDVVGMVNDVEEDFMDHHEKFERLLGDAEKPLYFGCTNNFTQVIRYSSFIQFEGRQRVE